MRHVQLMCWISTQQFPSRLCGLNTIFVRVCLVTASPQALMLRGGFLKILRLDGCSTLGDAAVRMICRACPRLTELNLLGCSAVRPALRLVIFQSQGT